MIAAVALSVGEHKITICHATSSVSNPFTSPPVDYDSIVGPNGHGTHTGPLYPADGWGDIIPSFWWHSDTKDMVISDDSTTPPEPTGWNWYGGLNWPAGSDIYNNGCNVPVLPTETQPGPTPTTSGPTPTTPPVPPPAPTSLPLEETTGSGTSGPNFMLIGLAGMVLFAIGVLIPTAKAKQIR